MLCVALLLLLSLSMRPSGTSTLALFTIAATGGLLTHPRIAQHLPKRVESLAFPQIVIFPIKTGRASFAGARILTMLLKKLIVTESPTNWHVIVS